MRAGEKINILLVDDHSENLVALEAILDSPEYRLIKAHSGEEALKSLLYDDVAVILLDVHMPGIDGFETAALIKKRERSKSIPIIFLTAINKDQQYVFKGYSVGAVDYVFKPFNPDILKSKVAVFVDLFKKNRQIKQQTELLQQAERRERERELFDLERKSQLHYRSLAEAIPQIVWTANLGGVLNYCNNRWYSYTGLTVEKTVHEGWRAILHPDDVAQYQKEWDQAREAGSGFEIECRLKRENGSYRWHLVRALPERDHHDRIIGWLGTCTDIDDQKRAEQALSAEKERLGVTLRSIGDGVITTNTEGKIVLINKVVEELTGWTQEEAAGRPLTEVFHIINEKTRKPCDNPAEKVLTTGKIVTLAKNTVLIARDGEERKIADSGAPILDQEGNLIGVVLVFQDVTEKQKMEEELFKASKLESLGLLAGGIAHDFNNILTAILGNTAIAKKGIDPDDDIFKRLTEAEKASLRARDLIRQLLTFSKGGAPVVRPASVTELIHDSTRLALTGSTVRCEYAVEADLWPADIDPSQISQVINNMVINAVQSMPRGGVIKVRANNTVLKEATDLPLKPGRYIVISIEDQGEGIPEEYLGQIFDPFFTTKPDGSGLGLTSSYSIVKRHEGHIAVQSEVGVGSTFCVYLPASDMPASVEEKTEGEQMRGTGRILVMDDDPSVREVAVHMLQDFGFEVETATEGGEAIERYRKAKAAGRPFDLVFIDLTVAGGMGGKETIQKLKGIDPGARAVVASGYSNDPIMAEFKKYGFSGVIAKPYSFDDLDVLLKKMIRTD